MTTTFQVLATDPHEIMVDKTLEKRARAINKELRCVVCQNQSIDDSDAPLAKDLRMLVRANLIEGKTDQEVIDYVVSRYGDFVLLKPPVKGATIPLWLGPILFFIIGMFAIVRHFKKQKKGR
jgi:cytochrome c-type biogenesis protein CcmH|tara:strand:- start:211 stop:576 length:366 start_codon:yes stop_codon:yes gene_type:complete